MGAAARLAVALIAPLDDKLLPSTSKLDNLFNNVSFIIFKSTTLGRQK
jgi:hypothetical protein